jgi:hypothetical protein
VIATPHSQQKPGVMRKTVSQSIDWVSRQTNSEKTARDLRIIHDVLNLVQTAPWNFGINVNKPKDVAVRGPCTSVHLSRPITLAYDKLITKTAREINCAIVASTVCDNNLCARCPLAQMRKKWPQQRRLIKDRDND